MSSILDALKKSEAERQRGQPPTLGSHLPTRRQPSPQRRRSWLLPAIAVVAVAAAWFGGLFEAGDQPPQHQAGAAQEPEQPGNAVQDPAPELRRAEAPIAPTAPVAAPIDDGELVIIAGDGSIVGADNSEPSAPPPAPAAGQRPLSFGPHRPSEAGASDDPQQPAVPETATRAAAAPDGGVPGRPPTAAPTQQPAVAAAAPAQSPASASTAPAQPAPFAARPEAGAGDGSVTQLHALPFSVRRNLPEIAITMHVYNPDPEQRFALINGTRARDGQPLEGGLEVVAIRADGIVLRYDGTEFLHPIR